MTQLSYIIHLDKYIYSDDEGCVKDSEKSIGGSYVLLVWPFGKILTALGLGCENQ